MKSNSHKFISISSLIAPATILVTFLFILPLVNFLRTSFNRNIPGGSYESAWTLENFVEFFSDSYFLNILWNTILISFVATIFSLILAFPIAYLLARTKSKFKGILIGLVVFPLLVGNIVRDIGWIALFSETGLINELLLAIGIIDTPESFLGTHIAVIIAISNVVLPYMIISIQSVIENINPSLEESAKDLGASNWMVMRSIVIPLAMPGILAGTLFVFILSMNAYTTPLIIGGTKVQMMAPALYSQITEVSNWPLGSAMAVVLIAITLITSVIYLRVMEKSSSGNINASTEVKG
ncbi:ABC transporter permease [Ureibacillus massiliensis]|uniref:ABC transporter permease n=1 Tax=Ureibacillus massiliensis TaxID=292806 RepID=UPI00068FA539|nr:ABC transporter permease [Ureibacillus massiliensis]